MPDSLPLRLQFLGNSIFLSVGDRPIYRAITATEGSKPEFKIPEEKLHTGHIVWVRLPRVRDSIPNRFYLFDTSNDILLGRKVMLEQLPPGAITDYSPKFM